ncbi:1-deoxy-D-xylulose-5-phosphate synthase [Telluria mixta]|uniref:1-deoxy-D-xylulose-5-phosphate synthase n=1 Tax=Telluria mixta TaxID=34071 RepID=A0ABT2BZ12_9BURK|nr:1-deoxy-D-xylulose-5-phosphate synthase [Telluria mixta]MCS0630384.1 1-deoxy-D-xylulose-5-phosphate synthase [Telluria mixta]WEM94312.1 1-deoxy-D-xylulose-5-phosphate synthase [Telluria mixta]
MDLLEAINDPAALRALPRARLEPLARQLRRFLVDTVARTGGHLASNLGTVELTIALHYVFATPRDRIVWDVGHQSYGHKVLTGRRAQMHTLRQAGGLSGFPRRCESVHDCFGTAHSSTALSAALGMALAAKLQGDDRHVVAVCGDGALSAGMAFEALNNAGIDPALRLLVVVNHNGMSISPAVGALDRHLSDLASGRVRPGASLFEALGLAYSGPVDGHDLDALVPALEAARRRTGPQVLHVVTRKGKGYARAEAAPTLYHGTGRFDPGKGLPDGARGRPAYTDVFGDWLCDMAAHDPRLVGITPAMREGSGLVRFAQRFPDRYVDVGIAEQHALTFAGGLAVDGMKPVVAIYSTFLQRAYDQLIHDVARQHLDVTFAIDRAGLVGADGATHAGNYDIAYLRCVPNMVVMAASDEAECRRMLTTAYRHPGPAAVRYPRGPGPGVGPAPDLDAIPFGRGEVRRRGSGIAILAFGPMLAPSLDAATELGATVANMRFVKPLDADLVAALARDHAQLVTVEEGAVMGGAGAAVAEALAAAGIQRPLLMLGLPDMFIEHGDPAALLGAAGLDAAGIAGAIRQLYRADAPLLVANSD